MTVDDAVQVPDFLASERSPLSPAQRAVKRLIDIVFALVGLLLLTPVWLAIVIWIPLDSRGPVFFRQPRRGLRGRVFVCYKFRSMYVDTPDERLPDGSSFSTADSRWVTRCGRFLRRTTLDELPQFLNVLKGDMSVVGPRPDQPDQARYYRGLDWRRLLVKPGMSGWAWVNGRNSLPWDVRRDLDVEYVDHYSLWLDLRILWRTPLMVITGKGVYVSPDEGGREDPSA